MSFDTARVLVGGGAGVAIGAAYFGVLRASAPLYLTDAKRAIALGLVRLALAASAFGALVVLQPESLLPALGAFTATGFVVGRHAAQERP